MFDNIIGQDQVIQRIVGDIHTGTLPQSVLFYGEPYSGKSSAALECARVLGCEYTPRGEWGCLCPSCVRHRVLLDADTLLLGPRYFLQEIRAAAEVFRRMDETFSRYMLIRSVRKLLRRFDPVVWEGEEHKLKKVQGSIETAGDLLSELEPGEAKISDQKREKIIKDLTESCSKITSGVNVSHIPVHQVRSVTFWAHTSGVGRKKIIIMEGADTMLEGARNALLKILEEPPENVYFILLASNRGSIIQTVLSRVRPYGFAVRSEESQAQVLERIFREPAQAFSSLKEYFYAFDVSLDALGKEIDDFLSHARDPRSLGFQAESYELLKNKEAFAPFIEGLTQRFSRLLKSSMDTRMLTQLEKWTDELNRLKTSVESYNQNHYLLVEKLFYVIRNS
ncbi:MAG: hypothetical protein JXB03_10495 [Spirochaetales bacterium]|nr:hypothetical protein [Spirochaetales bacterium]